MPGTGKTATLVALIQCCVASRRAVLVTGYTNWAVDNIALRLVAAGGVDFVRIGRADVVHPDVRPFVVGEDDHQADHSHGKQRMELNREWNGREEIFSTTRPHKHRERERERERERGREREKERERERERETNRESSDNHNRNSSSNNNRNYGNSNYYIDDDDDSLVLGADRYFATGSSYLVRDGGEGRRGRGRGGVQSERGARDQRGAPGEEDVSFGGSRGRGGRSVHDSLRRSLTVVGDLVVKGIMGEGAAGQGEGHGHVGGRGPPTGEGGGVHVRRGWDVRRNTIDQLWNFK